MTREELHDVMQSIAFDSMGGSYGKTCLNEYLDAQKCMNCKHLDYDEKEDDGSYYCYKILYKPNEEEFGCNEFERGENVYQ